MELLMLIQTDPDAVDASLFLGWFVAFLVFIFFYILHEVDKLKDLKILYCFVEKEIGGLKIIPTEVEVLGNFKKVGYDKLRHMHIITIRHNFKKQIIYSEFSWDNYLANLKRKRWLRFFYDMEAYVFKRELSVEREIQTFYTNGWKVYFAFSAMFQFTLRGIATSFFIGAVFGSIFSGADFFGFLIGGGIGVGISLINTILYERGVIKPKKKIEKTKMEWIMVPAHPMKKIIDIYGVWGEKQTVTNKADKPEMEWTEFKEIVKGFEEVRKIQESELFQNVNYKKIDEKEVDITFAEMLKAKHSPLYQMRYLYNQIINAKEINEQLQNDNRSLYNQLTYLKSTEDRRRNEFVMEFLQEQQKNSDNFKDIFQKISGDMQFGLKWDKIASRVLKEVEEKRGDDRTEKLNLISQIMLKIVEKLLQMKNGDTMLDISSLMKQLELKQEDFIVAKKGEGQEN